MAVNKMYPLEAGIRVAMYCKTNAVGVNFTAFGIGSGENLSPETATALTKEEKRIPVTSVKKIDYGRYRIRGELSNTDLTEDILYRELGLYCVDPENGGEVLYTYGNAKGADFDYTETIRCFADYGITVSKIFEVDIIIDNYIDPTFTIDDSGKVDIATVNELVQDVERLEQEVETLKNSSDSDSGEAVEALTNDVENIKGLIPDEANAENKLVDKAYVDNAIGGGGGSATNSENFTYVVDSDQALADWANNVEGNDYTSVLIRKGTWTVSRCINLNITKTLRIVGEAGSKIIFAGQITGNDNNVMIDYPLMFYHDDDGYGAGMLEPSQFYMYGVTIEADVSLQGMVIGVFGFANMHNCHCKITNTGGIAIAFDSCGYMHNCTGMGMASQDAYGFSNCKCVTECGGSGYSTGSGSGYGFFSCVGVSKCRLYYRSCKTKLFEDCYASVGYDDFNDTYKVANTANGGFNNMRN